MTNLILRGNLVAELVKVVTPDARQLLEAGDTRAINAWVDSIDMDGDLEVPASLSLTGCPVRLRFAA